MNLQVDQRQYEMKRQKQGEIQAWLDTEMKDFTKLTEELVNLKEDMERNCHLIKVDY